MREDVAVDLSGAAGALPLVPAAVRTAFGGLELPWTAATALRVLAGDLSVPAPPAPVEPDPAWASTDDSGAGSVEGSEAEAAGPSCSSSISGVD